jgi:hypothetical protein
MNGGIFEGIIHRGKMNSSQIVFLEKATGKITTSKGSIYEGQFTDNTNMVNGKIILPNGIIME